MRNRRVWMMEKREHDYNNRVLASQALAMSMQGVPILRKVEMGAFRKAIPLTSDSATLWEWVLGVSYNIGQEIELTK